MKLKNVTIIGLIVTLFVIMVANYVNFDLVVNVRFYVDKNYELVEDLKENKLKLDIPLQKLNDINEYARTTVSIAIIKDDTMDIIQDMQIGSLDLKNNLSLMNESSFNRHQTSINGISSKLLQLQIHLDKMHFVLAQNVSLTEILETSHESRVVIENLIFDIEKDYRELNSVIISDLTLLLNTIFVILLILVGILFLILFRFVNFQIPYMVKGLTMLGDMQYDDSSLKKPNAVFTEEKDIHNYIDNLFEENRFIEDVREVLANQYIVEDVVDKLFVLLNDRIGIERVGLAFVDYTRQMIIADYSVIKDQNQKLGPGFEVPFVRTSLFDLLETKAAQINNDLNQDFVQRPKSSSLYLLNQEGIRSNLIIPMTMGNDVFGFLFLSSKQKGFFNSNHLHLAEKIVYEIKGVLNRSYFTKVVFSKITNGFVELVEKKDSDTGEHTLRMVKYSSLIAHKLGEKNNPEYPITDRIMIEVERNAAVHDIGKVGIPDSILKKPGKLTDEEWEIMRTHPTIGGDIFKSIREGLKAFDPELYKVAEDITRYHHEKWNGEGYPSGLKGKDIPLVARIVSVADVFDAISSKRIYKEAFEIEESFDLLRSMKGVTLDPYLVDVFLENTEEILAIYNKYQ